MTAYEADALARGDARLCSFCEERRVAIIPLKTTNGVILISRCSRHLHEARELWFGA